MKITIAREYRYFEVTDRKSEFFGRIGEFLGIRGGKHKLSFLTNDRWGQTISSWHFDADQLTEV